jgi:NodT family efflux transporter outer membrane factor (OMF) lipoprotein
VNILFKLQTVALAGLLTGCAVGPDYQRPAALHGETLPAAFGDPGVTNAGVWKPAEPSAHLPRGAWWEVYQEPELNRLETMVASNNQQIAVAAANYAQARAAARIARADFFPQISSTPTATRQRTSANTSPSSAAAGRSVTHNLFQVSGDASWELDLWGRIRRELEGAQARAAGVGDDLESARLSLQAEAATDYFMLRTLEEQLALLTQTAAAYQRALDMTENRHRSGIASDLDVSLAETQLKSVQAQIPGVELQRAQVRHALAVLCGVPATTFTLLSGTNGPTALPAFPITVPSEWLEHRPDISAAERRMAAANGDVGAAEGAYFPRVLLSAAGGVQSISASSLFESPSVFWAVGPSVQIPLFTGGRLRAQVASAKAAYEGSVAAYRQTVLTAFQDVEDQLAAQQLLAQQLAQEGAALAAAQRTLEISNNRYKAGVEQYLDVIVAQAAELNHRENMVQLTGQRIAANVALIKALGAGWHTEPAHTAGR